MLKLADEQGGDVLDVMNKHGKWQKEDIEHNIIFKHMVYGNQKTQNFT
jgi:hypothetical protein